MRTLPWNRLTIIAAFAIAMGHLEAVVVVYIRKLMGIIPTPEQLDPDVIAQIPTWLIGTEQTREAATIVMLIALGLLAGRTARERLGVFLLAFGIWDIFYYISLKAMIDWPASLATTDCLFLIPRPWYAPVWLPILASCGLIAIGLLLMRPTGTSGRTSRNSRA